MQHLPVAEGAFASGAVAQGAVRRAASPHAGAVPSFSTTAALALPPGQRGFGRGALEERRELAGVRSSSQDFSLLFPDTQKATPGPFKWL